MSCVDQAELGLHDFEAKSPLFAFVELNPYLLDDSLDDLLLEVGESSTESTHYLLLSEKASTGPSMLRLVPEEEPFLAVVKLWQNLVSFPCAGHT